MVILSDPNYEIASRVEHSISRVYDPENIYSDGISLRLPP